MTNYRDTLNRSVRPLLGAPAIGVYHQANFAIPREDNMSQVKATPADAEIVLKLYDFRREAVMRDARNWFLMKFWPANAQDVLAVANAFGTQENAYFRQILSYWEMAASLALQGAVHPDLFMDWSGEMMFFFAKVQPILTEVREATKNPNFFAKVEKLINQTNRQEAVAMIVERQKAMRNAAKA
jgi:hypothetical protein